MSALQQHGPFLVDFRTGGDTPVEVVLQATRKVEIARVWIETHDEDGPTEVVDMPGGGVLEVAERRVFDVFGPGRRVRVRYRGWIRSRELMFTVTRMLHPKLGELDFDGGSWWGQSALDDDTIEISVPGNARGLHARSAEQLLTLLDTSDELRTTTLEFVGNQAGEPDFQDDLAGLHATANQFRLDGLRMYPEPSNYFMVMLRLEGDHERRWRVEYLDGVPQRLSFDD